jgi:hypothetical protein
MENVAKWQQMQPLGAEEFANFEGCFWSHVITGVITFSHDPGSEAAEAGRADAVGLIIRTLRPKASAIVDGGTAAGRWAIESFRAESASQGSPQDHV